jgi:flagellar biogenesis protein FliO
MMDTYLGIIKVILILFGIVGGMVLLFRYAGKLKLNLRPGQSEYKLNKPASIYLGYKKFISVVEVNEHVFVVGVGEREMTLLAKWEKVEKVEKGI